MSLQRHAEQQVAFHFQFLRTEVDPHPRPPRPPGVECDAETHPSGVRFERPTPFGWSLSHLGFLGTPAIAHVDRDGHVFRTEIKGWLCPRGISQLLGTDRTPVLRVPGRPQGQRGPCDRGSWRKQRLRPVRGPGSAPLKRRITVLLRKEEPTQAGREGNASPVEQDSVCNS